MSPIQLEPTKVLIRMSQTFPTPQKQTRSVTQNQMRRLRSNGPPPPVHLQTFLKSNSTPQRKKIKSKSVSGSSCGDVNFASIIKGAKSQVSTDITQFVFSHDVQVCEVGPGCVLQIGHPVASSHFGQHYQFKLVTRVTDTGFHLDEHEDLFVEEDELVNVWKWVNGILVHGGGGKSTKLSMMKKLNGELIGKYVTPSGVTRHNSYKFKVTNDYMIKNEMEHRISLDNILPDDHNNYILAITTLVHHGKLRDNHYLSPNYSEYLKKKEEKKKQNDAQLEREFAAYDSDSDEDSGTSKLL